MKWTCCFLMLVSGWFLATQPVMAQKLYAYRNKAGKLVITDKPMEDATKTKKKFKLVDTFTPKHVRAKEQQRRAQTSRHLKGRRLTDEQIHSLVTPIARSMSVDPDLVKAVIRIESANNAAAISSKGAMGLMQLMPATAQRFGVRNAWDPRQNVRGGISYLRYLLSYFEGEVDLVLAAYNAGENAVDRHKGIPPYKETKHYVKKIRRHYTDTSHPFDGTAKRKSKLVAARQTTSKSANAD
ncbi:lytic transglycosylase domain-containing protein [Acanthopleuribacter pedis]|uniref:Lytic transglycosylase domain-containing protein n=1 Tax=Acanthopleuribacter pedis TaxID=442870 RepID=A0A8J7QCB5_9BACT|nr:lytic transglycosylase domain-containing protein [Acanthopleuribacter pedis]MBO1318356.1 lytic transglycosylase domain-containing protein [Acanthopleuribacter pedis]